MYEVFPLIAGVVIASLVPRFLREGQRKVAYGGFGVGVAGLATIVAGEEWFFIFVDLAELFIAMGVTLTIAAYYWPTWRDTEPNPAVVTDANAVRETFARVANSLSGRHVPR